MNAHMTFYIFHTQWRSFLTSASSSATRYFGNSFREERSLMHDGLNILSNDDEYKEDMDDEDDNESTPWPKWKSNLSERANNRRRRWEEKYWLVLSSETSLQEVIQDFAPRQQLMYEPLRFLFNDEKRYVFRWNKDDLVRENQRRTAPSLKGAYTDRIIIKEFKESKYIWWPKSHLISNITDINLSPMLSGISQTQPILFFTKLSSAPSQNTIDAIFHLLVYETISSWGRGCYFFSVDKMQRINTSCTMTVCTHRVNISHKDNIWSSIFELCLWVCTKETAVRTEKSLFRTNAQESYSLETRIRVVFEIPLAVLPVLEQTKSNCRLIAGLPVECPRLCTPK